MHMHHVPWTVNGILTRILPNFQPKTSLIMSQAENPEITPSGDNATHGTPVPVQFTEESIGKKKKKKVAP